MGEGEGIDGKGEGGNENPPLHAPLIHISGYAPETCTSCLDYEFKTTLIILNENMIERCHVFRRVAPRCPVDQAKFDPSKVRQSNVFSKINYCVFYLDTGTSEETRLVTML